jgi:hypothetical protein
VLKKLTATGILALAAAGVMLSGGPAQAEVTSAHHASVADVYPVNGCYNLVPGVYQPSWCNTYAPPVTYYPPATYPPATYYPGYNYGWNRWHGGWNRGPYRWHH